MYANKDGLGFWRAFIIALMFQFFLFGLCITLFPMSGVTSLTGPLRTMPAPFWCRWGKRNRSNPQLLPSPRLRRKLQPSHEITNGFGQI